MILDGRREETLKNFYLARILTGEVRDRVNKIYVQLGRPFRAAERIFIASALPITNLLCLGDVKPTIGVQHPPAEVPPNVGYPVFIACSLLIFYFELRTQALYLLALRSPTEVLMPAIVRRLKSDFIGFKKQRSKDWYVPNILALNSILEDYPSIHIKARDVKRMRRIMQNIQKLVESKGEEKQLLELITIHIPA